MVQTRMGIVPSQVSGALISDTRRTLKVKFWDSLEAGIGEDDERLGERVVSLLDGVRGFRVVRFDDRIVQDARIRPGALT